MGAVLAAVPTTRGFFYLVNNMTRVELSLHLEKNYPTNKSSIARRKPVYGVGENDADYITAPMANGKPIKDPAYVAWASMLMRAYAQKYHARYPTYSDITVCSEWHSFRAFRAWWLANYREDWQLDKDLLTVGNREYGPDTCIYIPVWINTFTVDRGAARGGFPIGACLHNQTGLYKSECSNPITGKRHYLGCFTTPEEAHEAWIKCKLSLAEQLKPDMDAIDPRIYNNAVAIIKAAI